MRGLPFRRPDATGLLVLVLATLAALWPLPVQLDHLVMPAEAEFSDLAVTHWPNQHFIRSAWLSTGELPLWQPNILSGGPFAGNPLSGLFYPPNLLHLIVPTTLSFAILTLAHYLFAALAMYWLLRRRFRCGVAGSVVAAAVYALGSRMAAHLGAGHIGIVYAWGWLPLSFGAALRTDRLRRVPLLATALAMQSLADIRLAYYSALVVAAVFMFRAARAAWSRQWRVATAQVVRLTCAGLLTLGLAAMMLVPLIEMAGLTARAEMSPVETGILSLPIASLLGTVVSLTPATHEWVTYLGLPLIVLSVAAVAARLPRAMLLAIGAIVAVVLSLGSHTPLYAAALRILPGLGWLRSPARFWVLLTFFAAILAGVGLDAWFKKRITLSRLARPMLFGAVVMVLALNGALAVQSHELSATASVGSVAAVVAVSALWVSASTQRRATLVLVAVIAALGADQIASARVHWRLATETEAFVRGATSANVLASSGLSGRVYSPSYSIGQEVAAARGIEQADGVDPCVLARYAHFMAIAGGYKDGGYSVTVPPFPSDQPIETAHRSDQPQARLLGLLSVEYVVARFPVDGVGLSLFDRHESDYVYRNDLALPRAWLVHQTIEASDEEAIQTLGELDARSVALVEPNTHVVLAPAVRSEHVAMIRREPNRLELAVDTSAPALLVLSEVWYPGWRALVDGSPVPVLRADYTLRAVALEGVGPHTVVLDYHPPSVLAGAAVSAVTAAGLLAWAVFSFRRQR